MLSSTWRLWPLPSWPLSEAPSSVAWCRDVHPGPHSTEGPTLSFSRNTCGRLFSLSSVISQSTNHAEHANYFQTHKHSASLCLMYFSEEVVWRRPQANKELKQEGRKDWDLKKSRSRKGSSGLLAEQWAWSGAPPKGGRTRAEEGTSAQVTVWRWQRLSVWWEEDYPVPPANFDLRWD